jgi:hypothetical protein
MPDVLQHPVDAFVLLPPAATLLTPEDELGGDDERNQR